MGLHPATRLGIVPQIGVGLFAVRAIPEGTIIWHPEPLDLVVKGHEFVHLPAFTYTWLDELGYRLSNGDIILPAGGACLFNHSCNPNVVDHGMDFGLAVKPIATGDQLLIDYGTFTYDPPFCFDCRCGDPACRLVVTNETARLPPRAVPAQAIGEVMNVSQPLHNSLERISWTYIQLLSGVRADGLELTSVCNPPRAFERYDETDHK